MLMLLTMFYTLTGIVDCIEGDYARVEVGDKNFKLVDVHLADIQCDVQEGDALFIRYINKRVDIICL